MQNTLVALQMLQGAADLVARLSAVIGRARREGRDVTDAELAELRAERKAAVEDFLR